MLLLGGLCLMLFCEKMSWHVHRPDFLNYFLNEQDEIRTYRYVGGISIACGIFLLPYVRIIIRGRQETSSVTNHTTSGIEPRKYYLP
ncbi:MAG: hypothetical protein ACREBS_03230 [Nitrososphaerales archaeon]